MSRSKGYMGYWRDLLVHFICYCEEFELACSWFCYKQHC